MQRNWWIVCLLFYPEMDSNPGPLPHKSGALYISMSHNISNYKLSVRAFKKRRQWLHCNKNNLNLRIKTKLAIYFMKTKAGHIPLPPLQPWQARFLIGGFRIFLGQCGLNKLCSHMVTCSCPRRQDTTSYRRTTGSNYIHIAIQKIKNLFFY